MNDSIKRICLDIHDSSSRETVNVKRGDTGRAIHIALADGGMPYRISEDCYAVFNGKKPDDTVVLNPCTIENNVIIYQLTAQTVAADGLVRCEVTLYGSDGKVITSPIFNLLVDAKVYNENDKISSSDEFNVLEDLLEDVQDALEGADSAINIAVQASAAAAGYVIEEASGETMILTEAEHMPLAGLRICGKTTQDGVPTPDAPVALVSPGDSGSLTVSITGENKAQSMAIATPNGLPGIRVSSGGNYTDENGQQWVCDEVDFTRGVYVQRVGSKRFDGSADELWNYESEKDATILLRMEILESVHVGQVVATDFLCSHFEAASIYNADAEGMQHSGQQFYLRILKSKLTTANTSGFRLLLADSPMVINYVLATPIETPLTEEDMAAYKALRTYKNYCVVSTDGGAYMELAYLMNAKKYLARLAENGGLAVGSTVRVAEVTLSAAKWTGTESPYSQVVRITGVTSYSQVDLKPSVEQMAIFHEKDLAFVTENDEGVVTVYAIGQKPTNDYTMQVSITEVSV